MHAHCRASSFLYSVSEDPDNPYLTPRSGDSLGYWIANTILAKLPAIYFYSFGLRFLLVWGSIALLKLLRLGKVRGHTCAS